MSNASKQVTWSLAWGIHKGTLMSRDQGDTVRGLDSLEECREKAEDLKKQFGRSGYKLWFATATSSAGESHPFSELTEPYVR